MFVLETVGNKFRVVFEFFDLTYTQPGVEFSTKEGARKHHASLVDGHISYNQLESFICQYWKAEKLNTNVKEFL